jgi:hypothetical protein
MKAFDFPTPEEIIQKPLSISGQYEKGISNYCKGQLEINQLADVTHLFMEAMLGISLYSYPYLN